MKKIDFSKTIGIIERAGIFAPSNESSEEKMRDVYQAELKLPSRGRGPMTMSAAGFEIFRAIAKKHGFNVIAIRRGLNR